MLGVVDRLMRGIVESPGAPVTAAYATCAGSDFVVKPLLSGDYRVFHDQERIAWANGSRPKPSTDGNENNDRNEGVGDIFIAQLRGDISTLL